MTPREAKEHNWEISRMDEGSAEARAARKALLRDMKEEVNKGTPDSPWFQRALGEYTISEFANLIKYRGSTRQVRGRNLLTDLVDWADLPPGKKLADFGRTCWTEEYVPVVEKRKSGGEYILTLYGKTLAWEWAYEDREE